MANVIMYGLTGKGDPRAERALQIAESGIFDPELETWDTTYVGLWFRRRGRGLRWAQIINGNLAPAATQSLALVPIAGNNLQLNSWVIPDITWPTNWYRLFDLTLMKEEDWVLRVSVNGNLRVFYRGPGNKWRRYKVKL